MACPRTPWCRRCRAGPRSRRAGRTARPARCAAGSTVNRTGGLAVAGAEVAGRRPPPGPSTASGRTLDGPQPKRPSAGRRSAGMEMSGDRSRCNYRGWHAPRIGSTSTHRSVPSGDRRTTDRAVASRCRRPTPSRTAGSPAASPPSPSRHAAVDAKAKALKAAGEPVIGFGAGEPDFPTPDHIVEAAVVACRDPSNHRYTPAAGPARAEGGHRRQDPARLGLRGRCPARSLVTNGGKHAVYNTFEALLNPGDEVLLPAPYWTTYPEPIALAGGAPVVLPTDESTGLPGHRRPARGGPHRRPPRPWCSCRRRTRPGAVYPEAEVRGHRRVGRRARHLGRHRRDLRAPHLRRPRVHLDADRRARAGRPRASCSTAWPRPTP